ncbi:hypothetical protein GCM10008022_47720 [Paenibacillus hunanensis]|nr:hypothetical protein GCM10008022_47720 [Paenibacillus hunanensis]
MDERLWRSAQVIIIIHFAPTSKPPQACGGFVRRASATRENEDLSYYLTKILKLFWEAMLF